MKRKWVMIGATSALGIGMIAGGAVMTANAMTIEDTRGETVGERITIQSPAGQTPTEDAKVPASVTTPASVTSPVTPQVQEPPKQTPAPTTAPKPAPSPVSVQTPVVVSAASPVSVDSPESVPSAD